jgi:tetratricopeptide (TPR) repeat protein
MYSALQLAEAFIHTGELSDALDALNAHLADAPHDADARRLRAAVLLRRGDDPSLGRALDDLAALPAPDADDWAQQATIHERMGAADRALDAARRALALRPADERLAARLTDLLAAGGALDEALGLVRTQPRTWRWLEREGDLLAQTGDSVTASARYGLALVQLEAAFPPDDPVAASLRAAVLLKRAEVFRRQDNLDSAAVCLDAAAALTPAEPFIPFLRGLLRALAGDEAGALALCGPACDGASPALHAEMQRALAGDARLAPLARQLNTSAGG